MNKERENYFKYFKPSIERNIIIFVPIMFRVHLNLKPPFNKQKVALFSFILQGYINLKNHLDGPCLRMM